MVGTDDDIITTEQAREIAIRCHEAADSASTTLG